MRVIRKLFVVIIGITLALILVGLSFFISLKGNIILIFCIYLLQAVYIVFGMIKYRGKSHKVFYSSFLAVMLLFLVHFVASRNLQLLRADSKAENAYTVVKNRVETTKSESKYNAAFITEQHENVKLLYIPELKPAIKLINIYLEDAEEATEKLFPNVEKKPLTVRFDYDEKVFKAINPEADNMLGFYTREKNQIDIMVEDSYVNILASFYKEGDFSNTVLHEFSHYKFEEYVNQNKLDMKKIPAWLNEGTAAYIGYNGPNEFNAPNRLVPFKELISQKDWIKYSNDTKGEVYVQAHYAVSELIMLKGDAVIRNLILKTNEAEFDDAFMEVVGMSLQEYEKTLEADMKNGWKKYNKMITEKKRKDNSVVKIECLEEYLKTNPDNVKALIDLEMLYSSAGNYDKAKQIITRAIEKQADNDFAWRRLALSLENLQDFNGALNAYENESKLSKDNFDSYVFASHILLLSDVDRAVAMANEAVKHSKASYIAKNAQEIKNYAKALKSNKPYEGCLRLIKSEVIVSEKVKKALIQNTIKNYPSIKNSARNELEKVKL